MAMSGGGLRRAGAGCDHSLAPKWSPLGIWQRARVLIRQPGDIALALRIGMFFWTAALDLERRDLPAFLDRLRRSPRPAARNLQSSVERITRLRQPWVRLALFRGRDTCYTRALVLYRFLDAGPHRMRIHFGVEPGMDPKDRLRGHAWVTTDGEIVEAPDPVREGRVREIYVHPPMPPPLRQAPPPAPGAGEDGGRRDVTTDLARFVLGDVASAREAGRRLSHRADWRRAVALAAAWRVIPVLRSRVAACDADLDSVARRELHERSVAAAVQSTTLAHRAATALAHLDRAGVAAVAFKGVALIANLYDGPGQRMVGDVDILINRSDLEAACRSLAEVGFSPVIDDLDTYVDFLDRRPYEGASSGNHFLVLKDLDGVEIDLHWRLSARPPAPMAAEHIIGRAEAATRYGHTFRVASPLDAMVLAVHHAVRANFAPDTTVKDLLDLAAWWRAQPGRWTVDDVMVQAQECELAAPLLALWGIVADFDCAAGPAPRVGELTAQVPARYARDAMLLREAFHLQLRHGRVNGDLLRALSPVTVARFFSRRWRNHAATVALSGRIEAELGLPPRRTDRERITDFIRELAHLSPRKLACYRALLRAHQLGPKSERRPLLKQGIEG